MFLWLLILWSTARAQFNLYHTDRTIADEQIYFDCFYYHTSYHYTTWSWLGERSTHTLELCIRPVTATHISIADFGATHSTKYTFKQLRLSNTTVRQLLAGSAPIDVAELYALYVEQTEIDHPLSTEVYYYCDNRWFGIRCQYNFDYVSGRDIDIVINQIHSSREETIDEDPAARNIYPSCYVYLTCDRGSPMCLDWREICNGQVDCIDSGADEAHCYLLDVNTCADDEYQCHNGLCIPIEFYHDDGEYPECLDLSDEPTIAFVPDLCYNDVRFRCEERVCRLGHTSFPCGDGQCVNAMNESCVNRRSTALRVSLFGNGTQSDPCWLFIACRTLLVDEDHCRRLLDSSIVEQGDLSTCELLFVFPKIPVLYGHVRYLYESSRLQHNASVALPDHICYDAELCDFLPATFTHQEWSCRRRQEIVDVDLSYEELFNFLAGYFRRCSTSSALINNDEYRKHPSIYCCRNSSKCIGQHRLMDHVIDCHLRDDEEYPASCDLPVKYRFKCRDSDTTCWSSTVDPRTCIVHNQRSRLTDVPFQSICDGARDLLPEEIDGKMHSDETDCQDWSCDNIYSRCDVFKSCVDGRDEYGCAYLFEYCSDTQLGCLSVANYSRICLPMRQVGDSIIDCFAAIDELQLCYNAGEGSDSPCWNHTRCNTCPSRCGNLDERPCPQPIDEFFCGSMDDVCRHSTIESNRLFERLAELVTTGKPFSVDTARVYPPLLQSTVSERDELQQVDAQPSRKHRSRQSAFHRVLWQCRRGLAVSTLLANNTYIDQCFCPPAYYGDSCEYQNQRVSLTLRFRPINTEVIYAFVITLVDQHGRINSFDQFVFSIAGGCSKKFNTYLLYSSRPKDASANYSIHIDAFDKSTLAYHASWHLSIPFSFLPVNRIVASLLVPFQSAQSLLPCNLTCNHGGQCMKYVNAERFFCRCLSNWSGSSCDTPVDCNGCSNDSLCEGSSNGRTICVCPQNKLGPRCLIPSVCYADACENGGRCISMQSHVNIPRQLCLCSEQYFGLGCEEKNHRFDISLENLETPPFVLIYTIIHPEKWSVVYLIQKLTHDQRIITLYQRHRIFLAFVKFRENYYLALTQTSSLNNYVNLTTLSPSQRCAPVHELFNASFVALPRVQLIKYYHRVCQTRPDLWCFYDQEYMCVCTEEQHANCLQFDHHVSLACPHTDFCQNDAQCFQNDVNCLTRTICICHDCYFGAQCQFYAKGFGLTLDDILRYEVPRHSTLAQLPAALKVSAAVAMLMLVLGVLSGVLCLLTFRRPRCRQVGCGLYLFASSITSILIMLVFTIKLWFVILSQIDFIAQRTVLQVGCRSIEFCLKSLLYTDTWLNACVAIERAYALLMGVKFDKTKSKRIAKWVIFVLPTAIMTSIVHEPLFRSLYDDEEEKRVWCVTHYSYGLQTYNSTIILVHFLAPFIINLLSAVFIILMTARQRSASQARITFQRHLLKQLEEHKQILISPVALVVLSLPRLIISLLSTCVNLARDSRLYLVGYFISFAPSMLMFVVFILPSDLYSSEFREATKRRHQ